MRLTRPLLAAFLALSPALLPRTAAAAATAIQGHLMGIPGDPVEVDMNVFHELRPGDTGVLRRGGARVTSVEVVRADADNVYLRALDAPAGFRPRADDVVYFVAVRRGAAAAAGAGLGGEEPVPLLTPLPAPRPTVKKTDRKLPPRLHGRALLRQFYQDINQGLSVQRITRVDTDGTLDRLGGGRWAFDWSGNGSYLDGSAAASSEDYRRFKPRARRLTLSRSVGSDGFFRAGRFFQRELPGVGTVDGLALEVPAGGVNLGVTAGNRPGRSDQEFSSKEALGALYVSAESGRAGQGSYAATFGLLHTLWLGKPDELAALLDQNFDLGPSFSVYQTAQLNFNAGAAETHKNTRLTRLDLSVNSAPKTWLTLRGGLGHFEPVDTAAERAFTGGDASFFIDNGYWRWWAGSGQALPWNLGLDEEVSWTRSDGRLQPGLWRATAWRQGLPGLPDGRSYLTAYNITGTEGTDYGSSAGLTLPLAGGKFTTDLNAGFRYDRGADGSREFKFSDATLRLDWRPGRTWQLDASASEVRRGASRSRSLSAGLSFRW
ncbi:MAG: hypothetical protein A2X32_09625 [Elusimicrobia bacterium GWC2_64_44]|nr:MAG: hypothetical protein A2X32_09625 [Elusimicrobia bacterium GWC2_64_44]